MKDLLRDCIKVGFISFIALSLFVSIATAHGMTSDEIKSILSFLSAIVMLLFMGLTILLIINKNE